MAAMQVAAISSDNCALNVSFFSAPTEALTEIPTRPKGAPNRETAPKKAPPVPKEKPLERPLRPFCAPSYLVYFPNPPVDVLLNGFSSVGIG